MLSQLVLAAATPSPSPKVPNADTVTPGVWGFVITFLIAVAVILLIIDMMRRVRRVRYRAEVNAKLDAEQAAADAAGRTDIEVDHRGDRPSDS
ncbi:hypothetical protein [Humibacter sp. RRB41]|uniref:hypothetical protein n=1 Tax=Humibacter sp. RRB41 TaxID=2919946 RepID=UPI001FA9AD03|nr:hypothetical protein [Humibacter sp. RRB41]